MISTYSFLNLIAEVPSNKTMVALSKKKNNFNTMTFEIFNTTTLSRTFSHSPKKKKKPPQNSQLYDTMEFEHLLSNYGPLLSKHFVFQGYTTKHSPLIDGNGLYYFNKRQKMILKF